MACDDIGVPNPVGRARLAVLIDGENASPRHARAVFESAATLGEARVRRIYGFGASETPRVSRVACYGLEIAGKAAIGAGATPRRRA